MGEGDYTPNVLQGLANIYWQKVGEFAGSLQRVNPEGTG